MKVKLLVPLTLVMAIAPAYAELKTGPQLPLQIVKDWAKLPKGWNFGECSGVAVDKDDNVWVFNRGSQPVIQFDKNGKFLHAWPDVVVKSSHGSASRTRGTSGAWPSNAMLSSSTTPRASC